MKRTTPSPRKPRPDVHDCAKGRMHDAPRKVVVTMPGGYIA